MKPIEIGLSQGSKQPRVWQDCRGGRISRHGPGGMGLASLEGGGEEARTGQAKLPGDGKVLVFRISDGIQLLITGL